MVNICARPWNNSLNANAPIAEWLVGEWLPIEAFHPRKTTFFAVRFNSDVDSPNQPTFGLIPEAATSPLMPIGRPARFIGASSNGDRSWPKSCQNWFLLQSGIELIRM
jgi:hypothetical protein